MIKQINITLATTQEDNARDPENEFKTEIEVRGDILPVLDALFYNGFELLDGENAGKCLPLWYRALHTLTTRESMLELKSMMGGDDPEGLVSTTRNTLEDIVLASLKRRDLALSIQYVETPDPEDNQNADGRCPFCDTEFPAVEDLFVDGKESINVTCVNPKCKKGIHFFTATIIVGEPTPF